MANIIHRIGTKASLSKVYDAVSTLEGVSAWWTKNTTGSSEPGGRIDFAFFTPGGETIGKMKMDVVSLEPNKKVHWRVLEGPQDWIGTEITFDLHQDGDYTILLFTHKNWKEAGESMAHCSTKWAIFMMSLKQLVETGKGKPSPDDQKIDNWN